MGNKMTIACTVYGNFHPMQCDTMCIHCFLYKRTMTLWPKSGVSYCTYGEMFYQSTSLHCVNRILQALNQTSCINSFFIIVILEALHHQINCRHTIGISTCPHCNEVQPCNLYIKCTLCPFIAWRELKASWWVALRRSLVFWWGCSCW